MPPIEGFMWSSGSKRIVLVCVYLSIIYLGPKAHRKCSPCRCMDP